MGASSVNEGRSIGTVSRWMHHERERERESEKERKLEREGRREHI